MRASNRQLMVAAATILASFGMFVAYLTTLETTSMHVCTTEDPHVCTTETTADLESFPFNFTISSYVVLALAGTVSAVTFSILSRLLKRATKQWFAIAVVAGFCTALPFSGGIGPSAAVIFGMVTGSASSLLQKATAPDRAHSPHQPDA